MASGLNPSGMTSDEQNGSRSFPGASPGAPATAPATPPLASETAPAGSTSLPKGEEKVAAQVMPSEGGTLQTPACPGNCNGHGRCVTGICQCETSFEGPGCETGKGMDKIKTQLIPKIPMYSALI
eukprot:Selendium_serpulae@DN11684_c0_g1_i1.p1